MMICCPQETYALGFISGSLTHATDYEGSPEPTPCSESLPHMPCRQKGEECRKDGGPRLAWEVFPEVVFGVLVRLEDGHLGGRNGDSMDFILLPPTATISPLEYPQSGASLGVDDQNSVI